MSILKKIYIVLLDFVEAFVLVGAIFLIIYAFLFRPYQVNGESMDPNFHNNEYILTSLISIKISELERGDVIVFRAPANIEKDYIKRVIGLPGDKVQLQNGKIYINGNILDESFYLSSNITTDSRFFLKEGEEITVPADNYLVLGDNRSVSSDSREWGFVSKDKIIGKSVLVYWPPQRIKLIEKINYSIP